jgi:uncharacterized membrane protein YsdA (DUF1294 family)
MQFIFSLLVAYAAMSIICFAIYAKDKTAAVKNKPRTPERTLWLLSFLGGWPGALVAQKYLRHKSSKPSFLLVFWLSVVANLAITSAIGWLYFQA